MATQGEQVKQNQTAAIPADQLVEALKQFAVELKKPTEEEQRKRDEQAKQDAAQKAADAEQLRNREKAEQNKWYSCAHARMLAGQYKHTFRGQVTSGDGLVHPVCMQCNVEGPTYKATSDELSNGANLEDIAVTPDWLVRRHRQSFPEGCNRTSCLHCKSLRK